MFLNPYLRLYLSEFGKPSTLNPTPLGFRVEGFRKGGSEQSLFPRMCRRSLNQKLQTWKHKALSPKPLALNS